MMFDFNKYNISCGDCANYFSCKKAKEAMQEVCDNFEDAEEEE